LEISSLIRDVLHGFNPEAIDTALGISYKQGEGAGVEGKRAPAEISYHV